MIVPFEKVPATGRLWVFGASRQLSSTEKDALVERMEGFVNQWAAHKKEVTAGWKLYEQQLLMVGVDETATALSGCSIDSMVNFLKAFEAQFSLDFTGNTASIFYRDNSGTIRCKSREMFEQSVNDGSVTSETIVFDNSVTTMAALLEGLWEKPFSDSWHSRVFEVPA